MNATKMMECILDLQMTYAAPGLENIVAEIDLLDKICGKDVSMFKSYTLRSNQYRKRICFGVILQRQSTQSLFCNFVNLSKVQLEKRSAKYFHF